MKQLEITWGRVLQIWWAMFWMSLLCVFLPCFAVGFILGIFCAIFHIPIQDHLWALRFVGLIIGLPLGLWVIRQVLERHYKGFRIALVATEPDTQAASTSEPAPPASV